ncbi:Ulp1 protease family, C-terminal catalytic domain [Phytophthora cactorum]|nr:Ulp1 protease family, C-terminal catalytic domain [Phytophthora cactorum]
MEEMEAMQDSVEEEEEEESCPPTQPTATTSSQTLLNPITVFPHKFYHKDSTKGIYFEEVVGYVAGHAWLNDAVVSYVSDVITASQVGVHVLSSFVVDNEKFPSPPRSKLFSMKFIVLPANIKRSHWTLIVVAVHRHGMMTVHMYDSLCTASYRTRWRRYGPITAAISPCMAFTVGMPRDAHPFPANVDIEC